MSSIVRNSVLIVFAAAAGGFALWRLLGTQSAPEYPTHYNMQGVCLACKAKVGANPKIVDRPPYVCEKCGKQAVYPWYFCPKCKHRFVPALEKRGEGPPVLPMIPTCPKCRGNGGSPWIEADPEQQTDVEYPLPAWP